MTESEESAGASHPVGESVVAAGLAALVGTAVGGPIGGVVGGMAVPILAPMVRHMFAELSQDGARRILATLETASSAASMDVEDFAERAASTEQLRLLTGLTLEASARTAYQPKARVLGRALAEGVLAADDAVVDIQQLIIAAVADLEAPHVALLDMMQRLIPYRTFEDETRTWAPVQAPDGWDKDLRTGERVPATWTIDQLKGCRPVAARVLTGLLGTMQKHGLVIESEGIDETLAKYGEALERKSKRSSSSRTIAIDPDPRKNKKIRLPAPEVKLARHELRNLGAATRWSVTDLGASVLAYFTEAGAEPVDAAFRLDPESVNDTSSESDEGDVRVE